MFMNFVQFGIAKSLIGSVRNLALKEKSKECQEILQDRLGVSSIDEYMKNKTLKKSKR